MYRRYAVGSVARSESDLPGRCGSTPASARRRSPRRHADAVPGPAAGQGLDVDDDQRPRLHAAADVPAGRGRPWRHGRPADRHDPERRAQGVHRSRHQGFQKSEIEKSADRVALEIDNRERTVVGSTSTSWTRKSPTGHCGSTRRSRPTSANVSQRCARSATTTPSTEPWTLCVRPRKAPPTSCSPCVRPSDSAPRAERSPTPCAACGVFTARATRSDSGPPITDPPARSRHR